MVRLWVLIMMWRSFPWAIFDTPWYKCGTWALISFWIRLRSSATLCRIFVNSSVFDKAISLSQAPPFFFDFVQTLGFVADILCPCTLVSQYTISHEDRDIFNTQDPTQIEIPL
ncbi:hypothetical protein BDZ91DRAFT_509713 [Kalaharituber pfeilii]|nr:hypothetical protein BDZ91DRAFT_509713 [Kalaharituber pfeilii]